MTSRDEVIHFDDSNTLRRQVFQLPAVDLMVFLHASLTFAWRTKSSQMTRCMAYNVNEIVLTVSLIAIERCHEYST